MSLNVFADRRIALGFGGAILGLGMIAGLSMGAFAPRANNAQEPEQVASADAQPPPASTTSHRPATPWAEEGAGDDSMSDDWAGSDESRGDSFSGEASVSDNDPSTVPQFGRYSPVKASTAPGPQVHRSGGGRSGPIIRSKTAPDAPALRPPRID